MPISRAMARSEIASGPLVTNSRRAVGMISSVVAARSRSRRDGGTRPPLPGAPDVCRLCHSCLWTAVAGPLAVPATWPAGTNVAPMLTHLTRVNTICKVIVVISLQCLL